MKLLLLIAITVSILLELKALNDDKLCSNSSDSNNFYKKINQCFKNDNEIASAKLRIWWDEQIQIIPGQQTAKIITKTNEIPRTCYSQSDIEKIFIRNTISNEINHNNNDEQNYSYEEISTLEYLNGAGKIIFKSESVLKSDNFLNGYVQKGSIGYLNITSQEEVFIGSMKQGCFDGLIKSYDLDNNLRMVGTFSYGSAYGPLWYRDMSLYDDIESGFLYKYVNNENYNLEFYRNESVLNVFSGNDVAFIYPDLATILYGTFSKGILAETKQVNIDKLILNENGMPEIEFSQTFGPIFRREIANKTYIVENPLLKDPYESKFVEIAKSTIPKAGEGVLIKKNVKKGTIVSYFNGLKLKENDVFKGGFSSIKSVYLVEIGIEDDFLDIPPEYANSKIYQASTGHKINHAKVPTTAYTECLHPRFGKVLCSYTLMDLKKGDELFTKYDVTYNKHGMKNVLKTILDIGHAFSGKSKKEFVSGIRPYLEAASKMAENIPIEDFVKF